jgi:myo-inositol-1(or 4)-monophosphatase
VRDLERVAHDAAARAGAMLRARHREGHEVSFKSEVDLVTAVDRDAEALIVAAIRRAFPAHTVVAEESAPTEPSGSGNGHCWYVDPIDGTTNFAHTLPHFAVSIAVERDGEPLLGVVYDPMREELFTATRGEGALLNGRRIGVSTVPTLDAALLATGFPYDRRSNAPFYLAFFETALRRSRDVRRAGSAALDLCWVACGRLDGYWEWKLRPWDTAAGRLIVREAGGSATTFSGEPHRLDGLETAASNGVIHGELVAMLSDVRLRLGTEGAADGGR